MRVFVYGFGPYRQFRDNITARIIKSLPKTTTLTRTIFPVRFQRRQFIAALNRYRPDIILGLGQSSRKHIAVESRARNRRRATKLAKLKPIVKSGPSGLPTTLQIRFGRSLRRSNNAGDYVCNYSMYVMLDALRRDGGTTRFGFIHIPHDWNLAAAVKVVRRVLRQIRRGS